MFKIKKKVKEKEPLGCIFKLDDPKTGRHYVGKHINGSRYNEPQDEEIHTFGVILWDEHNNIDSVLEVIDADYRDDAVDIFKCNCVSKGMSTEEISALMEVLSFDKLTKVLR